MGSAIRAKFSQGTFTPVDPPPLDLVHEGEEVLLTISPVPHATEPAIKETAGAWKDLIDGETLKQRIYADRVISTRPPVAF